MTSRPSPFERFLCDSDGSEDLPSPVLVTHPDSSQSQLFAITQTSDSAHRRDLSFSADNGSLYEVQRSEPTLYERRLGDSPKFSGSSVFESRVINPIALMQRPRHREASAKGGRRRTGPQSLSPSVRKTKTEKLFPGLAKRPVKLKDSKVKSHPALGHKKAIPLQAVVISNNRLDSPRFPAAIYSANKDTLHRGSYVTLKRAGQTGADAGKRQVTPRPPSRHKVAKSPLSARQLKIVTRGTKL